MIQCKWCEEEMLYIRWLEEFQCPGCRTNDILPEKDEEETDV